MMPNLNDLFSILKGGAGSGNWGHAGRAPTKERGGSLPTSGYGAAMSITTGPTAKQRQQEAAAQKKKTKIPVNEKTREMAREWAINRVIDQNYVLDQADKDRVVKDFESDLKELVQNSPLSMRVPDDVIMKILDEGRFKNQHETGTSEGYLNPITRQNAEKNAFGWELEEFPIYGYFDTSKSGLDPEVYTYGRIRVVFNDKIKERTTVTLGDSLGSFESRVAVGTPALDPKIEGIEHGNYSHRYKTFHTDYVEAQVHGGLTVKDIQKVVLPANVDENVMRRLAELNIPYEISSYTVGN